MADRLITGNINSVAVDVDEFVEIRPGVIVGGNNVSTAVTTEDGSLLRNYGIIMAGSGIARTGVNANGGIGVTIQNAAGGLIFGDGTGVVLGNGTATLLNTLFNAGTITGNETGVSAEANTRIVNTGMISGFDRAVKTAGELTNLGVIDGDFGVDLAGTGQTVINAGTIQGTDRAVFFGTDSTLQNTGIIHGDIVSDTSVTLGSDDRVINSGTIFGDIVFEDGVNFYDGRLGKLNDGAVFLGGNDDIALGGAGDEKFQGGFGNDFINGGAGNDTAVFGDGVFAAITVNLGLAVAQNTGQGNDTLVAIENVITGDGNDKITGSTGINRLEGGKGDDVVSGNAGNDNLFGQDDNDILIGGAGVDLLNGGAGRDSFRFDTVFAQAGVDKIADFVAVDDTIQLKRSVFTALPLPLGQLNLNAFRAGAAAQDPTDRIIYNKDTGQLFYDADGTGAAAKILFATLLTKPGITVADFLVI